jgi:predicted nucleic acid-binding protein
MTTAPIPSALFTDTSFFYTLLDRRDRDHGVAKALAAWVQDQQVPLVTTWEIVVETVTLLRYRYSYQAARSFIQRILPRLNLIYLMNEDRAKALDWFRKLSRDNKISVCDAISYLVVREHLNFVPCLTFDEDFEQLGLTVVHQAP